MSTTLADLGADEFTFEGDRTTITYYPQTPGPIQIGQEGGELRYQGPEGNLIVYGPQISAVDSPLGRLVTVTFPSNPDMGAIQITVVVPHANGVAADSPVTFASIAIKSTTRGFNVSPGVDRTYDLLPLIGQAAQVPLPL